MHTGKDSRGMSARRFVVVARARHIACQFASGGLWVHFDYLSDMPLI